MKFARLIDWVNNKSKTDEMERIIFHNLAIEYHNKVGISKLQKLKYPIL